MIGLLDMAATAETSVKAIEDAFKEFTNRDDIAIVMINQYVSGIALHGDFGTVLSQPCFEVGCTVGQDHVCLADCQHDKASVEKLP